MLEESKCGLIISPCRQSIDVKRDKGLLPTRVKKVEKKAEIMHMSACFLLRNLTDPQEM